MIFLTATYLWMCVWLPAGADWSRQHWCPDTTIYTTPKICARAVKQWCVPYRTKDFDITCGCKRVKGHEKDILPE